MRIISKKTLKDFYEQSKYSDSKSSLEAWHNEVLKLDWKNPNEVKEMYRNASIIGNEKVVFNIAGNKYRLIVKINYYAKIIFIKFIGTHKQYDKVNMENL
jgi:mRNA interferase HigB